MCLFLQIVEFAKALLREYMHKHNFKETLRAFDAECPRSEATIESRQVCVTPPVGSWGTTHTGTQPLRENRGNCTELLQSSPSTRGIGFGLFTPHTVVGATPRGWVWVRLFYFQFAVLDRASHQSPTQVPVGWGGGGYKASSQSIRYRSGLLDCGILRGKNIRGPRLY